MEEDLVEIVFESTRRFVAGDMDGLARLYTEDAVGQAMEGWPEQGPFVGRAAVISQYARLRENWSEQANKPVRTATNGDWVAVEWLWQVRGAASGIAQTMSMTAAYRLRGTRIAESNFFWTWDEALHAIGLSAAKAQIQQEEQ